MSGWEKICVPLELYDTPHLLLHSQTAVQSSRPAAVLTVSVPSRQKIMTYVRSCPFYPHNISFLHLYRLNKLEEISCSFSRVLEQNPFIFIIEEMRRAVG